MEDLLECSVCMESYEVSGEKLPRVFPCQHTFCQSCVRNLAKRNSVTCPICRHHHKCSDVGGLPRNLTLLRLLEHDFHKSDDKNTEKPSYCTSCIESFAFCRSCCDASMCEDCLVVDLRRNVKELERQLKKTEKLCSNVQTMQTYWVEIHELMMTVLRDIKDNVGTKSGYSHDVYLLSSSFADSHERNHRQDFMVLHDSVTRFRSFREDCERCLKRIREQLSEGVLSCSMVKELSLLRRQCDYHNDEVEDAKASAYWRSLGSYTDLMNMGAEKFGFRGSKAQDQPPWFRWYEGAKIISFSLTWILVLLLAWIVIGYLTESTCSSLPLPAITYYFCLALGMAGGKTLPAIAVFLALFSKLFASDLTTSLPQQCGRPSVSLKLKFADLNHRYGIFVSELRSHYETPIWDPNYTKWLLSDFPRRGRIELSEMLNNQGN